jgi:NADPH:quinone reductase-like Zn-dependent oxidoreductase
VSRTAARAPTVAERVERGEIGGRTVQIVASGRVECAEYDPRPLPSGTVRVRTVRSAISPGTEMTFIGPAATNVHLHRTWNPELRLFEPGSAPVDYPIVFGYRAAGSVVESHDARVPVGARVFGSWQHTELAAVPADEAALHRLPEELSWDDGVDIGHMGPICLNAVAFAEGAHAGTPAVVFGAGVVGLITAQLVRIGGASSVEVVDRIDSRLEIAAALGFDVVDASGDIDVAAILKRRHGANGIGVAWECTGSTHALNEAIRTVRQLGTVIAVGFYQGSAAGLALGEEFHHNGVRIVCGQIGNVHPTHTRETLRARILELAARGELTLGGLPRLTVPVEEVSRGFAALQHPDEVLQVALAFGPPE